MFHAKVIEEINTQILCSITFFEHHAGYDIMCKTLVTWGRPQMTIRRMRIAIYTITLTISNIIVFPLQQWLQDRASMLRFTYIVCLVLSYVVALGRRPQLCLGLSQKSEMIMDQKRTR